MDCRMYTSSSCLSKEKDVFRSTLHTISKNVGLFLTDKTPINELFNKAVADIDLPELDYPT